jgi:hypothetical protein
MVEERLGIPQGSTVLFKQSVISPSGLQHANAIDPSIRIGCLLRYTCMQTVQVSDNTTSVGSPANGLFQDVTRLLCRWMDPYFNPQYSSYGVHELCVRRKGSSLQFRRWSNNKAHSTLWMALFFKTFESTVSSRLKVQG